MKKTVFSCLLVIVLIFGLIGCGTDGNETTADVETYTVDYFTMTEDNWLIFSDGIDFTDAYMENDDYFVFFPDSFNVNQLIGLRNDGKIIATEIYSYSGVTLAELLQLQNYIPEGDPPYGSGSTNRRERVFNTLSEKNYVAAYWGRFEYTLLFVFKE